MKINEQNQLLIGAKKKEKLVWHLQAEVQRSEDKNNQMRLENNGVKENLRRSFDVLRTEHRFAIDSIKAQYEHKIKELEKQNQKLNQEKSESN